MAKYIVRVGDKFCTATGLGSRRAAIKFDSISDADALGCIQTCGEYSGEAHRLIAWSVARDEKRFAVEEVQ